jgi:ParB/RepB/Spo0J family partition protein
MGQGVGLTAFSSGRKDLLMIDPRVLRVDAGLNVRDFEAPENRAHLEYLKASIRTEGVKQPLTVRHGGNPDGDGFVPLITDGECRWRAVMELIEEGVEIARVPCQPEGRGANPTQRTIDLATRNSGKPFAPLEMARICLRLSGFGMERNEIAAKLARSPSSVSQLLALLEMPEPVQDMVKRGEVAPATALKTVRAEGPEAATTLLQETQAEAEAEVPPILAVTGAESPPKAKKVTEKRIKAAKEKRAGIAPQPKPMRAIAQAGPKYDEALVIHVNKFLAKCIDGTYDDIDNEVPEKLVKDATQLANTIKLFKGGFRSEAAE